LYLSFTLFIRILTQSCLRREYTVDRFKTLQDKKIDS
jgi:hypothetical protein